MITLSGRGIHTGVAATVTICRTDGPVTFVRGSTRIRADIDELHSSHRSTVLGRNGVHVGMVEHLLAALSFHGFWHGLDIVASGEELPVLDGSAREWLLALAELGAPPPAPEPLAPFGTLELAGAGGTATVIPGPAWLEVEVDFAHPAIGRQRWAGGRERLLELMDARTFGFLEDLAKLNAAGLALGANLENTLVYDSEGPIKPARSPNEPVRHKALDAVGDLYLLGRPLEAQVRLARSSHELHAKLVRELRQQAGRGFVT